MKRITFSLLIILLFVSAQAQNLQAVAQQKINELEALIKKAEKAKLDATREKMTVSTAAIFLKFADWDEAHHAENKEHFQLVPKYKANAESLATELPQFEIREVIAMLDTAMATLQGVLAGTIKRRPATNINWYKVTNDNHQLTYNGKPVFLHDYTWKPKTKELTEYLGNQDGFLLAPSFVTNESGAIKKPVLDELKAKPSGRIGFIFLNHKEPPQWVTEKYKNFTVGERLFTAYDIDNPGAREMQHLLLKNTVPYIAGKKYGQLGYMLANEPHWNTVANEWASGGVSEFTMEKFRTWLQRKHASATELNGLWKTDFKSFNDLSLTIPMDAKLQGTPQWYDWMTFNADRVTDWFTFLHDEIKKCDPAAKTHIKVMPQLWSDNRKDHGLDFERLTRLTEIIGNDASAEREFYKSVPKDWEKYYAVDWRELSMSYDFFKSVCPDKIIYNTEGHFLSTNRYRDLYMQPAYARAMYWLAHMQGLNATQTWYWARNEDGSIMNKGGKGYAGSINQQPRIVNEVAATYLDLNAFSEEITAMQRQPKPLRIFYSPTSAINKVAHMDELFELYESLYFEGMPIGFATKDILLDSKQPTFEAVLVHQTEFVTADELQALQGYLDAGGTVLMDAASLKKNEYGQSLSSLKESKGKLVVAASMEALKQKAFEKLFQKSLLPIVEVKETNALGKKGCVWRSIRGSNGKQVISIVNLGKTDAQLTINLKGANKATVCTNLLTGQPVAAQPTLKPFDVFFAELSEK